MLLLRLWNYLRGYVIINVNGYFIEKFLNLCANKGIYLWNIKRSSKNNASIKISIRGFKALRGICKKTKCKVKVAKKVGIPFILHRHRKRKTFYAGFVIFLIIVYILCSFIWVIEINGLNKVSSQQIVDFLAEYNIKPGIIKYKFDKDAIIPNMLITIEGISWADIRLVGTKVIVDVVERVPKPEIVDRTTPCNIYANNNGVIKELIAKNGVALVKEGDVVRKGQLLITGIVENKFNPQDVRYVHADGSVKATTWYEDTQDIELIQQKKERTGECTVGYSFKIFSKYYDLYNSKLNYQYFDQDEKNIRITLWKNYEFPVEFVVKKYYKIVYNKYTLTEEQAKEIAKSQAFEKTAKRIGEGALEVDRKIEYEILNDNQIIRAIAVLECIEDIAYKEKIVIE